MRLERVAVELLEGWPLFDNSIVRHGYTSYLRDYELVVVGAAATPDGSRSYPEGRYQLLFTHCVLAYVETAVRDDVWASSWDDVFTRYSDWEAAGCPAGYVFGVGHMVAYPGARYVPDSVTATEWSRRLGRPMHEVTIETNGHNLRLVFHSLRVRKVAEGDPATDELSPIEPRSLLPPAT